MKKFMIAALISILPLASLRRNLYRLIFHYDIPESSSIGLFTIILVSEFSVGERVRIGVLNFFKGPMVVKIGNNSRIGKLNKFTCASHIVEERFESMAYTPILDLGEDTLVLDEHFFDVYGKITIGNGSWVAGHGSQFWTHGLSVKDRDITIGEKNYIGSAVLFSPGTSIGSNNIVALGSVVMSKLTCNASLVSGNPAKPFRSIEDDLKKGKYHFSFDDWSD
jgi:acetyltransferase-like isoleucine patch superfamily enzyme